MEIEVSKRIKRADISIIEVLDENFGNTFYLFFLEGEPDMPLMLGNKICFFSKEEILSLFRKLEIEIYDVDFEKEIDVAYDLQRTLKKIKSYKVDKSAVIINSINIVLDVVNAMGIKLPLDYKKILYPFADHLTFERSYDSFLSENNIKRDDLINAFYWINGAIISNAAFSSTKFSLVSAIIRKDDKG